MDLRMDHELKSSFVTGNIPPSASLEFQDYRDYAPGDDLHNLYWNVLARSDREVVTVPTRSALTSAWKCCQCCQYPVPVANAQLETGNIGIGNIFTLATFIPDGDSPHSRAFTGLKL